MSESLGGADLNDEVWFLLEYQKNHGFPEAFVKHIRKGIELAAEHLDSLLLFSGGETRVEAGPRSEAASYYSVADHYHFFGQAENVRPRTAIEDYARDSFENLLFSICRYREITRRYPEEIYLVSFSFKRARFIDYHRKAIRFPETKFHYFSVDLDENSKSKRLRGAQFDIDTLKFYEETRSIGPFKEDPYGCYSKILQQKRQERDIFRRTIPYDKACPEIRELLNWCGPNLYDKQLPWTI